MSEVTDVILVKMNSKMKDVEKLSEEEEEYYEENRAYYADKAEAGDRESAYFESGARTEVVRRVGVMQQQDFFGEDLVNGNISEVKDNGDPTKMLKNDQALNA